MADYGNRADGTKKGKGYFGELSRPDGAVSTELSFDFDADGKNITAPLLVPTLTKSEVDSLLNGDKPTEAIYQKAQDFALKRIRENKSPFANGEEEGAYKPLDGARMLYPNSNMQ